MPDYVSLPRDEFVAMLKQMDYLKGWSPHTENYDESEWVLKLVSPTEAFRNMLSGLLTDDEREALDLTAKLANLLSKICRTPTHPEDHPVSLDVWKENQSNDWAECAVEIHAIQHRLMAQACARAFPDQYRLMGAVLR